MNARARRLLSAAGFWLVNAALAALVWFALVEPVAAWFRAQSDDIEEKAQLLSRYERALSRGDADRPAPAGVLVPGATDAVRAAALQEAVKRAAGAAGARCSRCRPCRRRGSSRASSRCGSTSPGL